MNIMIAKSDLNFLRVCRRHIYKTTAIPMCSNAVTLKKDDFYDHANIFKFKSTWELYRSSILLKLCSINWIVDNSMKIMNVGQKCLGGTIFDKVAKPTIYNQFAAGDNDTSIRSTAIDLAKANIRLMAITGLEEDVGESLEGAEEKYDKNRDEYMKIANLLASDGINDPDLQLKITAFMSADVVTKLSSQIISGRIKMADVVGIIGTSMSKDAGRPIHFQLESLTEKENEEMVSGMSRIKELGDLAVQSNKIRLLVDGEYTYMNPGISAVALSMMLAFNKNKAVVCNTYQCYLKDTYDRIKEEKEIVMNRGIYFGAKVVRGAYLERERFLASENGYEDPVNPSYETTGAMYNRVIEHMMEYVCSDEGKGGGHVVVATHNEDGVWHAISTMERLALEHSDERISFGQIYGMGEQISIPLASAGYIVYKSVPFGPVNTLLPYFARRAAENRVVLQGTRKEQELLKAELLRRFYQRKSY